MHIMPNAPYRFVQLPTHKILIIIIKFRHYILLNIISSRYYTNVHVAPFIISFIKTNSMTDPTINDNAYQPIFKSFWGS